MGGGGGGLMAKENPTGGGSEPKNISSGVTFNFTDVSIASIDKFSKSLCVFKFYYSFKLQTCYLIYFESSNQSVGSPSMLLWKVSNVQ